MLGITFVGLTCRLDVTELLEKRVKSRFSHRFIYLSDEITFPQHLSLLTSYLKQPLPDSKRKGTLAYHWNKRIDELVVNPEIKDSLLFRFNISTDINSMKQFAALVIGNCLQSDSLPEQKHFMEAFKVLNVDSKATLLQG